jgi:hypothetical protein
MNYKITPFLVIMIIGIAKMVTLAMNFDKMMFGGWLIVSTWVGSIGWAYWKDRDIIANYYNFEFKDGKNSTARVSYIVFIILLYLSIAWIWN